MILVSDVISDLFFYSRGWLLYFDGRHSFGIRVEHLFASIPYVPRSSSSAVLHVDFCLRNVEGQDVVLEITFSKAVVVIGLTASCIGMISLFM